MLCCLGGTKVCRLKKAIWTQAESKGVFWEVQLTISVIEFHRCHLDHSVFVRRTKSGIVVLVVYVDILLTSSDSAGLLEIKQYLKRRFVINDMGRSKYFLRIEVARQKHSRLFCQRAKVCPEFSWGIRSFRMQACYYSNGSQCGFIVWWESCTWWSRKI